MRETLLSFSGRLALLVASAALVAAAVGIGASMFGLVPEAALRLGNHQLAVGLREASVLRRGLWGMGSVVAVLVAFMLLRLAVRRPSRDRILLTRNKLGRPFGGGEVSVSRRGLCSIAAYTAQKHHGVFDALTDVRLSRRGWRVDLRVVLAPHAALPEVVAGLKTELHDAMYHHTGLPVDRLRIFAQLDPLSRSRRVR